MLIEDRKSYKFDFANMICRRLKLFFDSEFIMCSKLKDKIINVAERIIYECKHAVLVGSVAVGRVI